MMPIRRAYPSLVRSRKVFYESGAMAQKLISRSLYLLAVSAGLAGLALGAGPVRLAPAPSPVNNPLKGLAPYANPKPGRFPHSLEFTYLPLAQLMTGPEQFNWEPLERFLAGVAGRGNQAVFRVWLEFPTQQSGVPRFLIDHGVKITEWTDAKEHPPSHDHTPDYSDERLVKALEKFVAALGRRYDHDPRVGFITAGLLGKWGEWHDAPRRELFASVATQVRVMRAYQMAFQETPILLRYPTGDNDRSNATNASLPFGYHDDSFAWGTLPLADPYSPIKTEESARRRRKRPPKRRDGWHFLVRMQAAGPEALDKWKRHPIGGEIRPELWGQVFDEKPTDSHAQDFAECVRQSHVTWLMDSGMFGQQAPPPRYERAVALVRRMGYDFYVESADVSRPAPNKLSVALDVQNEGVAPFYRNWAVELGVLSSSGKVVRTWPTDWKLMGLLPGAAPRRWQTTVDLGALGDEGSIAAVRVVNPMPGGKPLRFANADQDRHAAGWLSVGRVR
jgi:Domain of unknown function (DUF4832)